MARDEACIGREGVLTVGTRGGDGPGEVHINIRGGTETVLAWSDEPLPPGATVLVIESRGARQVDVVEWADSLRRFRDRPRKPAQEKRRCSAIAFRPRRGDADLRAEGGDWTARHFGSSPGTARSCMPVFRKARFLTLSMCEAEVDETCVTKQGISLNVRAVIAFKVGNDHGASSTPRSGSCPTRIRCRC